LILLILILMHCYLPLPLPLRQFKVCWLNDFFIFWILELLVFSCPHYKTGAWSFTHVYLLFFLSQSYAPDSFLCPRDEESGVGGILIYPCPSFRLSGYRYMVCPAISSYSFGATALIFCRMFIHIMEVCMSTEFWWSGGGIICVLQTHFIFF
jgi:hypothetical protein